MVVLLSPGDAFQNSGCNAAGNSSCHRLRGLEMAAPARCRWEILLANRGVPHPAGHLYVRRDDYALRSRPSTRIPGLSISIHWYGRRSRRLLATPPSAYRVIRFRPALRIDRRNALVLPRLYSVFQSILGRCGGGISLLSDSNLDWGQDLPLLSQWQKDHPDRTIILVYFGSADPAYYGIQYFKTSTQSSLPSAKQINELHPVYAVSATVLQGTYLTSADYIKAEPFREAKPFAILGGSIYLFDRR